MGLFGSIAGAETALTRVFGRHVFEIAALLRVSQRLRNYRVWIGGGDQTANSPRSHVEPVSEDSARNGNFRCRDGGAKSAVSPLRDRYRDAQRFEKPPFWRD